MLLSGKSLKHDFIRFVSATMVSQVVFSLYSMVDGLMVSIGVNEYAMSAVNLAIPFTNALFSIAVLFAVGSSTLIAIFIAQKKRHEADTLFSQNFATLLILGAVATALVLLFWSRLRTFSAQTRSHLTMSSSIFSASRRSACATLCPTISKCSSRQTAIRATRSSRSSAGA